ncbi:C40 family peptidase [Pseudoxanthomonas dokdonensis]|uniref:C40 family peptidase n=1 Tax=Pseudoxanthomonas dokdonensis TaxID=344882 RepID=UPI000AD47FB2|nr:C40 family peptidase [Pseudoxanthomonas dokdonensis]
MDIVHYRGSSARVPALRHGLVLLATLALLTACGSEPNVRPAAPASTRVWPTVQPADPQAANAVLMRALGLVGTPYRWGGNTPDSGFDCSGLVTYVYRDMLDLRLPRTSTALAQVQGPRLPPQQLAPADLVFFGSRGNVSHVGIYVGEGRFVHAPSSGGTVRLDYLDGPYWRDHYSGAKRVLN